MAEIKKLKSYLKTDTAKTIARFTGGNLIVILIGGLSSFLYARWIDPETMGEFRKYAILTGYLALGNIFIDSAFRRNFTYLLGKGEEKEALYLASVCKWFYLALSWVGVSIFLILATRSLIMGDYWAMTGWLTQTTIFFASTYSNYLNTLFRSNQHFDNLNKSLIYTSLSGLVFLPLVYYFKYFGLSIRSVLQDFVKLSALTSYAPYKQVKARFDWAELKRIAKVSVPLQIPVALDSYILTPSLSFFVFVMLGEYELGIYSMAMTFLTILGAFTSSINQIFITKSMLNYGKHDSIVKAFSYIIRPTIYATVFMIVVIIVFVLFLDFFFAFYAPKYIDCVPLLSILSFEIVFKVVCQPFEIMVASLMYKERIIIRVVKIVVIFVFISLLPINIVNVAWALIAGATSSTIVGYYILFSAMKKEKAMPKKVAGSQFISDDNVSGVE